MIEKNRNNTLKRRDFIKTSLVGGAAIGVSAIGFPSILTAKSTLKVGYVPIVDHLAMLVSHAKDNNRFKRIDVTPRLFKSWNSIAGALKAGVIDSALLLSPLAIDIYRKGVDIKTVLVGHRNGSGITVSRNSGIVSAKDFKGKVVAIPARVSTHTVLLDTYLRGAGLSLNDVRARVIAPPYMIKSLKRGGIDAFIVADPYVALAESTGVGRTLLLSKSITPNHICCAVVVRQDIMRKNPDGMREWVVSMQNAGRFIDRDKAQNQGKSTAEIALKYTPHKFQTITNALINPHDRIMYNNLKPKLEDFQQILDMSTRAGILPSLNLDGFLADEFAEQG